MDVSKEKMMAKKRLKTPMQMIMQDTSETDPNVKLGELIGTNKVPPNIVDGAKGEGKNITKWSNLSRIFRIWFLM